MKWTHPDLAWILRKFASCVRGTNFTHVFEEMSNIPVSIVILSISSVTESNFYFKRYCIEFIETWHAFAYKDITHHKAGR